MAAIVEGVLRADDLKVAIVASRFNHLVGDRLVEGALEALRRLGARDEDLTVVKVPGAFEIPPIARRLATSGTHDAVICLGAVIRGATPHFNYIAAEVAKGVAHVALEAPVPVIFGVLTTDTLEQALERAGSKGGNKGSDAALAAVEMVSLFRAVGSAGRR